MKGITLVVLAVLGLIHALPQQNGITVVNEVPQDVPTATKDVRFVGDLIAGVLEDLSVQIREMGMDPWAHDGLRAGYALPVPVLLDADVHVEDLGSTGLSDIVINRLDFGLISLLLNIDVSLPEITLSVGDAGLDVTILGSRVHGKGHGKLAIREPRVSGTIQFGIGIISGISVRDMKLEFVLGGMDFDGSVHVFDQDITWSIQNLVRNLIPNRLIELRAEINELVEIIALQLVDIILA